MPVMQVRAGRLRPDRFRLSLRPSVPELLVRCGWRWSAGWWRELAALAGLLWLAASGGRLLVGLLVLAVVVIRPARRAVAGVLAAGRVRRRWAAACHACRLVSERGLPRGLRRVRRVPAGWALRVRLRPGQDVADVQAAASRLAGAMGGRGLRVAPDLAHAGRADVVLVDREALGVPIDAADLGVADGADVSGLRAVEVGRCEDGGPWLLPILGAHVLVAGATGAGKGSVLWSIIRGLGPAIRAGTVQIWAADPKGGMELAFGEPLFARFATHADEIAELLEDAVTRLNRRAGWLRGRTRAHTPTVKEPLIVVLVDEIAALTAYCPDRETKQKVAGALSLLLSQGRAPGVSVIGAVQDPRKDVVPFRDLFPVRVLLRVAEASQIDLVLGSGARERGAWADRIPASLPGVGYVVLDGDPTPVRVRASWVDDAAIHQAASAYGAAPQWAQPAWTDLPGGRPARVLPRLAPPVPLPPSRPASAGPAASPARPAPSARRESARGWVPDVGGADLDGPTVPLRAWSPPHPLALPPVPVDADDGSEASEALWRRFAQQQQQQPPPDDHERG